MTQRLLDNVAAHFKEPKEACGGARNQIDALKWNRIFLERHARLYPDENAYFSDWKGEVYGQEVLVTNVRLAPRYDLQQEKELKALGLTTDEAIAHFCDKLAEDIEHHIAIWRKTAKGGRPTVVCPYLPLIPSIQVDPGSMEPVVVFSTAMGRLTLGDLTPFEIARHYAGLQAAQAKPEDDRHVLVQNAARYEQGVGKGFHFAEVNQKFIERHPDLFRGSYYHMKAPSDQILGKLVVARKIPLGVEYLCDMAFDGPIPPAFEQIEIELHQKIAAAIQRVIDDEREANPDDRLDYCPFIPVFADVEIDQQTFFPRLKFSTWAGFWKISKTDREKFPDYIDCAISTLINRRANSLAVRTRFRGNKLYMNRATWIKLASAWGGHHMSLLEVEVHDDYADNEICLTAEHERRVYAGVFIDIPESLYSYAPVFWTRDGKKDAATQVKIDALNGKPPSRADFLKMFERGEIDPPDPSSNDHPLLPVHLMRKANLMMARDREAGFPNVIYCNFETREKLEHSTDCPVATIYVHWEVRVDDNYVDNEICLVVEKNGVVLNGKFFNIAEELFNPDQPECCGGSSKGQMDNTKLEQEAAAVAKPEARRVTLDHIESRIKDVRYTVDGTLTTAVVEHVNGFKVVGTSAAADPLNFDQELGEKAARARAVEKLWELEGFLLREEMMRGEIAPPRPPVEPYLGPKRSTRVFYIDCGSLPPQKAKAHLDNLRHNVLAGIDSLNYENFFFATRDEDGSRIEVFD